MGEAGKQMQATITTGGDAANYLGLYRTGEGTGVINSGEAFPDGVTQRADIHWGVVEYGSVTATLVFKYGAISSSANVKLLKRTNRTSAWTDVTADFTHDTGARTFTGTGITEFSEFSIGLPTGSETVRLQTRVFLQGPYDDTIHEMTTTINSSIPKTSPYSEDARTVSSIPETITDWVLVQLRSTSDGAAVASKSAFLRKDGKIVDDDGTTEYIEIAASAGDYYIIIKHRNHLAIMSDEVHTLSADNSTLYDFTVDASADYDKYYGGDAKILETNGTTTYGMYMGDVNQDGEITTSDYTQWYNDARAGLSGYHDSDMNLDKEVTTSDYTGWYNNARAGASSQVP